MRASFLAQDRVDLPEAVKSLAQQMSAPTRSSMEELEHMARYLKGMPSVALVLKQQRMPKVIRMSVDSDFAADRKTRRSTTGMVQRLGTHCVKATSNLQASAGLNVGETEYYALVHGSVHGLGMQSLPRRLGNQFGTRGGKRFHQCQELCEQARAREAKARPDKVPLGAGEDCTKGIRDQEGGDSEECVRYPYEGVARALH